MSQTIIVRTRAARLQLISGTVVLGLLAACGESKPSGKEKSGTDFTYQGAKPPPGSVSDLPVKKIEITGNDSMKFNVTAFEVTVGQPVEVTFKNVGTMPAASMGHNLVVLERGTEAASFIDAGFTHAGNQYIDPSKADQVLASTKILGPKEQDVVSFVAPSEPGRNDYVCTFPGHFAGGMHGVMHVAPRK